MSNLEKISLIIPYYNHPEFLKFQLTIWNSYSDFVKEHLDIILVDDCSDVSITDLKNLPEFPKNLRIFRILNNISWNEKGARNLGVHCTKNSWLLHTDFDHWFDDSNLIKIIMLKKNIKTIYRFQRLKYGEEKYHQHKETHLISRKSFDDVGGFDEDFSGSWGGAAYTLYFNILQKKYKNNIVDLSGISVNCAGTDRYKDCQLPSHTRVRNEKDHRIRKEKETNYKKPKVIRFDWMELDLKR